jgi:sulfonate transport system substrate-binding protein
LRTPESTRAAMGGDYVFTNFFVDAKWLNTNKPTVQKLVNAWVKKALKGEVAMYSPDGRMPKGAPEFVLSVLQQFDDNGKGKSIDLTRTYTTEFVDKATAS